MASKWEGQFLAGKGCVLGYKTIQSDTKGHTGDLQELQPRWIQGVRESPE